MHTSPDLAVTAKIKAGSLVFIFCCLLSSTRLIIDAPRPGHIRGDDISSRSEQRLAVLRAYLPATGVVGYIGETGNPATADYYLTQYALAPLVVDDTPNHTFVVGNFPSSPPTQVPANLRLVKDFGNGVMLFCSQDLNWKDAN